MANIEIRASGGMLQGHIPRGERNPSDSSYEVSGEAIEIQGLGSMVKTRPTNLPTGISLVANGCSEFGCPWFTKKTHRARSLFARHQDIHPGTPYMVMLVKVPDDVYEELLEKTQAENQRRQRSARRKK